MVLELGQPIGAQIRPNFAGYVKVIARQPGTPQTSGWRQKMACYARILSMYAFGNSMGQVVREWQCQTYWEVAFSRKMGVPADVFRLT